MNAATYIKFDDITNALLDVKPTKLATVDSAGTELHLQLPAAGGQASPMNLETSFNVQLALSNALDKLNSDQLLANSVAGQQTPSLGKCNQLNLEEYRAHFCRSGRRAGHATRPNNGANN